MKIKYSDLINQTFDFPQEEFELVDGHLEFHGIPLYEMVEKYGSPLKFNYLPKITENIQLALGWFKEAMMRNHYKGKYYYCYCTKSSHFSFVIDEVLKNNVHLEASSAFDMDIFRNLFLQGKINKSKHISCNGFKPAAYLDKIADLVNDGFENVVPIIDNEWEVFELLNRIEGNFKMGIRIASEEEPKFEFYTSRLGIKYKDIVPLYRNHLSKEPRIKLEMLHFFVNTGIRDTAYYWSELNKCLQVYCQLKKVCPDLKALNIGGGFPIKNSLAYEFDYQYMAEEIIFQIKSVCEAEGVPEPDIYTEFGSFTVGESGGAIFSVMKQKQQNDKEKWSMIDSSFMTTLPDSWAISKRFVMLPINRWDKEYERVLLGGMTCDSDDYYNSEQHSNAIFLPKFDPRQRQYIGFFNTGAYQDSLGGFGGLQHCLLPCPKHIVIDRDEDDNLTYTVFAEEQSSDQMLRLLGYPVDKHPEKINGKAKPAPRKRTTKTKTA
ncbi:MAG: arginine decarboxylase [Cryomorphaceae bacterium]|nr:MAG: arginine decarboxylase [Cryomorphaceae bacterium]